MDGAPWDRIVSVEKIEPKLISAFTCGDDRMDNWFLTKALEWSYLGLCQVYIAVDGCGVVGFFSLSPTSIEPVQLSNKLRRGINGMAHPGILLGRIAVRSDMQGGPDRVGTTLLWHALKRAYEVSGMIGGRFVVLDAKDERLAAWYERAGFRSLKDNRLRMILPMKDIASFVDEVGEDYFNF